MGRKVRRCAFGLGLVRQWRLLVPRRNSLARRFDYLEALVLTVAIGLCVVAVPIAVSTADTMDRRALSVPHAQSAADIADLSIGAGILTWTGITSLVLAGVWLARTILNRRRSAAWDREWEGFSRRASRSE